MKKAYSKPQILFESFALSTSIAGDCEKMVGNPSRGTCGLPGTGGLTVYLDTVSGCDFTQDDGAGDGFCYHAPTDLNNLFNS